MTGWQGVRERVAVLRAHPDHQKVHGVRFGNEGHGFAFEDVLSPEALEALESWPGVALPEEYRSFLAEVGAGGAGPGYGLFPVRRLANEPGWRWHGDGADMTEPARMAEPFPVVRTLDERIAALGEAPDDDDFTDEDAFDRAQDSWQERVYELLDDPDLTVGAICLCHHGCAVRDWLIVSGPARGTMWSDSRCDDVDLAPILDDGKPVSFRDWYLDWLDNAETTLGVRPEPAVA